MLIHYKLKPDLCFEQEIQYFDRITASEFGLVFSELRAMKI